jgi:hypothetical protein
MLQLLVPSALACNHEVSVARARLNFLKNRQRLGNNYYWRNQNRPEIITWSSKVGIRISRGRLKARDLVSPPILALLVEKQ